MDLIQRLLHLDPKKRLGTGSSEETTFARLKSHPYFTGIDFDDRIDALDEMEDYFLTSD